MKTRDSSPSVHVHLSDATSVIVHRSRSHPIVKEKASRSHSTVQTPPLSTGDVKDRYGRFEKHGRKIDRLMMEAGPTKSELKPWRKEYRLQTRSEFLSPQQRGTEQEKVFQEESKNINLTDQENVLCSSQKKSLSRPDSVAQLGDADLLLRTLVEAEIDGVAVANQLSVMREAVDGLNKDKRLSKPEAALIRRQQEALVRKIQMFEKTNHLLRDLLRKRHEYEEKSSMSLEEKEVLIRRLADGEAETIRLLAKLKSKESEVATLAERLDSEKDDVKACTELSKILELTRNKLETQLLQKEAEKEGLVDQIERLEQSRDHQQEEMRALDEELQQCKKQSKDRERRGLESLTLWTQKAEEAEESASRLAAQLQEKQAQLTKALTTSEEWCTRHSKEVAVRGQLEEEISALKAQVTDKTTQLQAVEKKNRAEREELIDQLHVFSTDNASIKLENQKLKASLVSSEEILKGVQSEMLQLKNSLRKHERLVDKYKSKVQQARLESEEFVLKLDRTQSEAREGKMNLEKELKEVKRELLGRLRELELLPDKLKSTELQLREAQEEAEAQERRSMEQSTVLSEFRHKVEQQGARLETFQQKNLLLQEENNLLKDINERLERKLEEITSENKDLVQVLSTKEATIDKIQQQLEAQHREYDVLSKEMARVLDDTQEQMDDCRQRALAKERTSHSKALDLQSQLSIAKTELAQLSHSKEEMERRFQGQLKNMKERMEQSDSTNRSLHNYVDFLKSSYSNVFSDSLLTS